MRGFRTHLRVRHLKLIGLSSSYLMSLLFFAACGQVGELSLASKSSNEILGTDEFVLVSVQACSEIAKQGQMMSLKQKITFEDTRVETGLSSICPFVSSGQDSKGNLNTKDGELRARYEQIRSLQLPANAVVCDVKLSNNLQRFRYDDVFFLTFNNYILATNNRTAIERRLTPTRVNSVESAVSYDLFSYDWMSLRTASFDNVADDFCLGAEAGLGSCSWPVSEQAGQIYLKWNPEVFIRLTANASDKQTFKFVITGDNDEAIDCYHEKLEFDVNVNYYIK